MLKIILFIIMSTSAFGAEVDQFTNRFQALPDSSQRVNQLFNQFLDKSLKNLADQEAGCDEVLLYQELRSFMTNHYQSALLREIEKDNAVFLRRIKVKDSIYQDYTFDESFFLGAPWNKDKESLMSPIIKMNQFQIGVDKFEHLFGRGYTYFDNYYLRNMSMEKVLTIGAEWERYYFGGSKFTTGVFSFADQIANFQGMRLWNDLLARFQDVWGAPKGPYISCINNRFVRIKTIDLLDYIDDAMDEAINCSQFPDEKMTEMVVFRISTQVNENGEPMSCPLDPRKLSGMSSKYGEFSKWLVNVNSVQLLSH